VKMHFSKDGMDFPAKSAIPGKNFTLSAQGERGYGGKMNGNRGREASIAWHVICVIYYREIQG